jgi:hypothetical protein
MRVSKSGNSLAVRLPLAVFEALGLKEGARSRFESSRGALVRVRKLQRPLHAGFVFGKRKQMPGSAYIYAVIMLCVE